MVLLGIARKLVMVRGLEVAESNAVYNTSLPQSNYVLVLGDYYLQIQRENYSQ